MEKINNLNQEITSNNLEYEEFKTPIKITLNSKSNNTNSENDDNNINYKAFEIKKPNQNLPFFLKKSYINLETYNNIEYEEFKMPVYFKGIDDIISKILDNNISYEQFKINKISKINNFNLQNFLENIVKQIDVNINNKDFENLINKLVYFVNYIIVKFPNKKYLINKGFFKHFVISLFEKNEILFEKLFNINNDFLKKNIQNLNNYDTYKLNSFIRNYNSNDVLRNYFKYLKALDNSNNSFTIHNNDINKLAAILILNKDLKHENIVILNNLNQEYNLKNIIENMENIIIENFDKEKYQNIVDKDEDYNNYFNNILLKLQQINPNITQQIDQDITIKNKFENFFKYLFNNNKNLFEKFKDFILNNKKDFFPETLNIRTNLKNNIQNLTLEKLNPIIQEFNNIQNNQQQNQNNQRHV